jgi:two-component system sensor kinase FixL
LNQPLTAILSNAQAAQRFLAQEKSDPAEIRDILQDIVADDQRASEVIRRLRTLLKKGEFQPQALDVNELMQEVLKLMQHDLTTREVAVVTEFAAGLPPVRGDRVQLQQVLINLVLNASDAMTLTAAAERKLTLRSLPGESRAIQISVSDTGSGFAPGAKEKIFEPYHTTKAEGLGLGLSLSRSIITAHGGHLWAENRTEGGATFHFTLPEWKGDAR